MQQPVSLGNHVAKGSEIIRLQHALDRAKYGANLLAAPQPLFIAKGIRIFRFRHPGNGEGTAAQLVHVFGVHLRAHQLILAMPQELEKVVEELSNVRGTHEIVEAQFPDPFPQKNPEVLIVQHAESAAVGFQQFVAIGMEGDGAQFRNVSAAQLCLHALAHLFRCVVGISQAEDF